MYRSRYNSGSDINHERSGAIPYNAERSQGNVGEFRFTAASEPRVAARPGQGRSRHVLLTGYGEFDFQRRRADRQLQPERLLHSRVSATCTCDGRSVGLTASTCSPVRTGRSPPPTPRASNAAQRIGAADDRRRIRPRLRLHPSAADPPREGILPGGFSAAVSRQKTRRRPTAARRRRPSLTGTGVLPGGLTAVRRHRPSSPALAYSIDRCQATTTARTPITLNHVPDLIGKVALDHQRLRSHRCIWKPGAWGVTFTEPLRERDRRNRCVRTVLNPNPRHVRRRRRRHDPRSGSCRRLVDIQLSGAYGRGLGRYGASGQLPDVTVNADGNRSSRSQSSPSSPV